MNNVGEFFFSSPIDPFDLSKDWGRSDDDQRHRLVINGAVQTSMEPATTAWQRLTHGFQVSGMLQAYSALPFNITSGVTTIQGTAGRPIVERRVHRAQCRRRQRLLQPERARQPCVPAHGPVQAGSDGRGVQPHESTQNVADAEHELRRRRLPDQPVADVRADHRRRRTESVSVRRAREVLTDQGCAWFTCSVVRSFRPIA